MMGRPRVSFILPIYNAAPYLAETLASLFSQTFEDFEIIAINDGSTDGTSDLLRATGDHRLRVLERENRGLVATLNEAVALAAAEYLARIDADDICLPHRLAAQVAFLDANAHVAVVGSGIEIISADGTLAGVIEYPRDPTAALLFRNALAHPAVMMRKSVLIAQGLEYQKPYRCAQDYGLWCECVARNIRIVNLPEVLVRYRLHAGQITQEFAEETQKEGAAIRNRLLVDLGLEPSAAQCALHNAIARDRFIPEIDFVNDAAAWLVKLAMWKTMPAVFDREVLMRTLTGRYVALSRFGRVHAIPVPEDARTLFADYFHPETLD